MPASFECASSLHAGAMEADANEIRVCRRDRADLSWRQALPCRQEEYFALLLWEGPECRSQGGRRLVLSRLNRAVVA
jgi:hypothetical protein